MPSQRESNMNHLFNEMVDELVGYTDYDEELAKAISWLDKTEQYGSHLDFYEKVRLVLTKHDVARMAKEWNEERKL